MINEGRDERDGMDAKDDEALWALLGQRPLPPRPSPYFARRVMREIALAEESHAAGWTAQVRSWLSGTSFSWRQALWSGVFAGACAVALLFAVRPVVSPTAEKLVVSRPVRTEMKTVPASFRVEKLGATAFPDESVPVKEVEVIADLDNILQREENRLWTEDTARF